VENLKKKTAFISENIVHCSGSGYINEVESLRQAHFGGFYPEYGGTETANERRNLKNTIQTFWLRREV
jgi:hypothetical protein